jgi:hypothetical protein
MDLSPARWIWFPGKRTLANTFILFRREIELPAAPKRAAGWITADSRYRLTINGRRVQWGPAPCDPRWQDVDPLNLTSHLVAGKNVIGVEVCYYGVGDGTWPMGSPGMIFKLDIDGDEKLAVVSDDSWKSFLDRAHRPGMYKRWFLRALQEEFDARLHPFGWDTPQFAPDGRWLAARVLPGRADRSSLLAGGPEYVLGVARVGQEFVLRQREIPFMNETLVPAKQLAESGTVSWKRSPLDWFESRVPDSFQIDATPVHSGQWTLPATPEPNRAVFATYEWEEQLVGWPFVVIDAPEGTIVELMVQEAHDPAKTHWLDSQYFAWSRFICREGENRLEPFDFESLRWLQVHVRGASRPVTIKDVGVRRRIYPWPNAARVKFPSDPDLQRLFDAAVNTLNNCAQETCVDGMARERQQYSGDGGHQLRAIRKTFSETRLPRRFLRTFSEGQHPDGYFMDCWPAFDRLARLMQRFMGTSDWGPLLDHGVGFNFDCWLHYLDTGDLDALREPYPRLKRFADYLYKLARSDGLLPVENLGIPAVWIDHDAYQKRRHTTCAFNLYVAAMLKYALAPMAEAFDEAQFAHAARLRSQKLLAATVRAFWDADRKLFVINRPWLSEEPGPCFCDRSLATAVLFDQLPTDSGEAVRMLAECPKELGLSYPANAGWRYSALVKGGRAEVVWDDFRKRWATMQSVKLNNTIQESWECEPDSDSQWSHCAVVPLFVLFEDLIGLRPLTPGYKTYELRPRLAEAPALEAAAHTPVGPVRLKTTPTADGCQVQITAAPGGEGQLVAPDKVIGMRAGEETSIYLHRAGRG